MDSSTPDISHPRVARHRLADRLPTPPPLPAIHPPTTRLLVLRNTLRLRLPQAASLWWRHLPLSKRPLPSTPPSSGSSPVGDTPSTPSGSSPYCSYTPSPSGGSPSSGSSPVGDTPSTPSGSSPSSSYTPSPFASSPDVESPPSSGSSPLNGSPTYSPPSSAVLEAPL
ncbi:hypothetical protein L7F22_005879 [Adiantum nelumboides]|nr:hypothetical protein [Adiantum nelumboides]